MSLPAVAEDVDFEQWGDRVARVSVPQRLSNFIECCSVEKVYLVLNITG